ncbi:hypothetical protein BJJ90_16300 [Escherichia coli]|nr:hypothetical protein BJJ90_16300 [Escherichia coli]
MVATSALTAISIACQNQIDVCRPGNLHGPVNLYSLILADSGERKTTVDKVFMKAFYLRDEALAAKWHLNRSQFGIRIDHDLASISDHSLASQSITIWHASDH